MELAAGFIVNAGTEDLAAGFIVNAGTEDLSAKLIVRHSGPAWLAGWSYRKTHTLTGSTAGALTNYQVGVKVYYGAGADGTEVIGGVTFGKVYCDSKCKTDFSDIRFTNRDGTTLLDYWLQEKIDSDYAIFWVEVDSVPASPSTVDIYIYYGNASATYVDAQQHGKDTFIAFDDFPGVALDGQWTTDANISVTVAGGTLTCKALASSWSTWHGIHMAVANVQGIRLESYGVSWAHVANDLFQFGSMLGVSMANQALGHMLSDSHADTAECFLSYYYDSAGLGKGDIQGQEPVDLIEQRDQNGVAKFFKDGVEQSVGGETSNDSFDTLMILVNRLTTYQCPNLYLDRILARSYVDPEPAHTAWGPEAEETLFAQFSVRNAGTEELPAQFEVGAGSVDLPAEFEVRGGGTEELPAQFEVGGVASVDLPAEFEVGQGSEDLSGEFVARRTGTADLLGEFIVRQETSTELPAEFVVRQAASASLGAAFISAIPASVTLAAEFTVRQVSSQELLGEFAVRHSGSKELLGELIVRHSGSVELFGEFIVRRSDSADVPGEFIVRHEGSQELGSSFEIRLLFETLFCKFYVRPTGSSAGDFIIIDLRRGLTVIDADREMTVSAPRRRMRVR